MSYALDIGDGKSIVIYDEPSEKWAGDYIREMLADARSLTSALDVVLEAVRARGPYQEFPAPGNDPDKSGVEHILHLDVVSAIAMLEALKPTT